MEKGIKISKLENRILIKKRMNNNNKMTKQQAKENIEKDYKISQKH